MPLQVYQTVATPDNNSHNCYPMLYYASPQQQYQQQSYPHYDPSTSFLPMQQMIPDQHPVFYTIDAHGNYILLAPPQNNNTLLSEQSNVSDPTPHSDASFDSLQPNDPSPSFYDLLNRSSLLNTSLGGVSRKSGGSGGKGRNSPAYKTMMCNMYSTNGSCSYGNGCQYAHGKEDIRPTVPHPRYKTQLCNKFNSPRGCQYGSKCHFRHPDDVESRLPSKMNCELLLNSSSQSSTDASFPQKQRNNTSLNGGGGKKKHGSKGDQQSSSMLDSTPSNVSSLGDKKKEKSKDSLIKLSMYHRFENYVGKNRKPSNLKRSNSSNTVGVFTFQRFAAMQEIVKAQIFRNKQKQQVKEINGNVKIPKQ